MQPEASSQQDGGTIGVSATGKPRSKSPPEWFARSIWKLHRAVYRITGGRVGLWRPPAGRWGAMRLTTIGRRTGRKRRAILGYFEDGPNLVTMAMNGWLNPEPKWWLNLQANPEATVELRDGTRAVRARAAQGDERARLWAKWRDVGSNLGNLDDHATARSGETAIVILEPAPGPVSGRPKN